LKALKSTFESVNVTVESPLDYGTVFTESTALYIALDAGDDMRKDADGNDVWDAGNPEQSRWWVQITALIALFRQIEAEVFLSENTIGMTPIVHTINIVLFPITEEDEGFYLEDATSDDYNSVITYLRNLLFRRPAYRGGAIIELTDLSTWAIEGGSWVLSNDNNTATQLINTPTPGIVSNQLASSYNQTFFTTVQVIDTGTDDDFIGFVIGYNPGDLANPNADYLLIDWKQRDQNPLGKAGLALSRVTGPLNVGDHGNNPAWTHTPPVEELQRAFTLGNVAPAPIRSGWQRNVLYNFVIEYSSTRIRVFVDDVLELDYSGSLPNGGFGFYNLSQAGVEYSGVESIIPYSDGSPFNEGLIAADNFFTESSQTDRAILFFTGGEPSPLSSVDAAETLIASLPAVDIYGFNSLFTDTTQTARIDNTPSDSVPVITQTSSISWGPWTTVISPVTYRIPETPTDPVRDFYTAAIVTRLSIYNPNVTSVDVIFRTLTPLSKIEPITVLQLTLSPGELLLTDLGGDVIKASEILQATCEVSQSFEVSTSYVQITQERLA
jgi:hypothetical protein